MHYSLSKSPRIYAGQNSERYTQVLYAQLFFLLRFLVVTERTKIEVLRPGLVSGGALLSSLGSVPVDDNNDFAGLCLLLASGGRLIGRIVDEDTQFDATGTHGYAHKFRILSCHAFLLFLLFFLDERLMALARRRTENGFELRRSPLVDHRLHVQIL